MADVTYEVKEKFGVLSTSNTGWTTELRLISWNGRSPKYDIRQWDGASDKMSKGLTLTAEEMSALKKLLNSMPEI